MSLVIDLIGQLNCHVIDYRQPLDPEKSQLK